MGNWSERPPTQGRPAPTEVDIHPLIGARWSPRASAERLRGSLNPGNAAWAGRSPVLFASAWKTRFSHADEPNRVALRDLARRKTTCASRRMLRGSWCTRWRASTTSA